MTPISALTALVPHSFPLTAETALQPHRRTLPIGVRGCGGGEWGAAGYRHAAVKSSAVNSALNEETRAMTCKRCDGLGAVYRTHPPYRAEAGCYWFKTGARTCPDCNGEGEV